MTTNENEEFEDQDEADAPPLSEAIAGEQERMRELEEAHKLAAQQGQPPVISSELIFQEMYQGVMELMRELAIEVEALSFEVDNPQQSALMGSDGRLIASALAEGADFLRELKNELAQDDPTRVRKVLELMTKMRHASERAIELMVDKADTEDPLSNIRGDDDAAPASQADGE